MLATLAKTHETAIPHEDLMATNWTALKLEYTHGNVTLRELAEKHGIKAAGVMRRAANEGWEAERKQESAKVSKAANEVLGEDRVARLAKFNDHDAKIAEALKAKAARLLNAESIDPQALSALSRVFDTAQKMGLLALGAATANTTVSTRTLEPVPDDEFLG